MPEMRLPELEVQDDPRVIAELDELQASIVLIDSHTRGMSLPTEPRWRIATACLDLAIEHQAGVHLTAANGLIGPAYALLRCVVDSAVRGVWLGHCATDADLVAFKKDGLRNRPFRHLIEDICKVADHPGGTLSTARGFMWPMMSDYTHTGIQHVLRRCGTDFTGPNYDPVEVAVNMRLVRSVGLFAALHLAIAANQVAAARIFASHMPTQNAAPSAL
jgi:hypothetical protein